MEILLDTHIALWFLDGSERMPKDALELILDEKNTVYVSCASAWEVSIKHMKNPRAMPKTGDVFLDTCVKAGLEVLEISWQDIASYDRLDTSRAEAFHRDPFDRMLIAQSRARTMLLLTHDEALNSYGEPFVSVV